MVRMDIGLYTGIILRALLKSLYMGSMSFWLASDIDRSSCDLKHIFLHEGLVEAVLGGPGKFNQGPNCTYNPITTWATLLKGLKSGLQLHLWPGCNYPGPPSNHFPSRAISEDPPEDRGALPEDGRERRRAWGPIGVAPSKGAVPDIFGGP